MEAVQTAVQYNPAQSLRPQALSPVAAAHQVQIERKNIMVDRHQAGETGGRVDQAVIGAECLAEHYRSSRPAEKDILTVEPLFATAEAALRFALNFNADHYARPVMNRHAAPTRGSGKGLAGLDGAAQAGMIRRALASLGREKESVLVARMAVARQVCECGAACCAGARSNPLWRTAVGMLADHVRTTALAGTSARGPVRLIAVGQYFAAEDERMSLEAIARACGISRQTAGSHVARVASALAALESEAWSAIEGCLVGQGVVESL